MRNSEPLVSHLSLNFIFDFSMNIVNGGPPYTSYSNSNRRRVCVIKITYIFCVSDLPQHNMILDMRTRWNSFMMMERF